MVSIEGRVVGKDILRRRFKKIASSAAIQKEMESRKTVWFSDELINLLK